MIIVSEMRMQRTDASGRSNTLRALPVKLGMHCLIMKIHVHSM